VSRGAGGKGKQGKKEKTHLNGLLARKKCKGLIADDALYLPAMRIRHWLVVIPLIGCSLPAPQPPGAEFLVADASSTYWVKSGPGGIHARVSPLILTRASGRFYEVFVGENTRSYDDAVFTAEPIYRRDLITGDSTLLWKDPSVDAWEKVYLARHPSAELLDPDSDEGDNVTLSVTGEADILGVAGPYLLYTHSSTLENSQSERGDTARGVIDIRVGKAVPFTTLAGDTAALADGGIHEPGDVRWKHTGYDVIARYDTTRRETQVVLRDHRRREWPLGFVNSPAPRIFWLDEPKVDPRVRTAISRAFEGAVSDEENTQLVHRGLRGRLRPGMAHSLARATKRGLNFGTRLQ